MAAADQIFQEKVNTVGKGNNSLMPKRLEGKVAIITGGARGIGEATVRLFVKHGAKVVIADIEDAIGTALASSLSPAAIFVHCDVSKEDDIESLIDMTMSEFGRLDILFNNAGVTQPKRNKSIMDFDANEFDHIIGVNVKGTALGMKHAARIMAPRKSGCIISTASIAGSMAGTAPHAYTASKHAVVGLTKNAACELGKYGIRVNCISPYGVATSLLINGWNSCDDSEEYLDSGEHCEKNIEKMEELMRELANLKGATLKANDIAEAALYLASDESKYVSGHNLVVDGGFTASKNVVAL